ncbi:MAG: LytTR family DNA-binding domain-containing protein [Lachnospiraceae bacterium]|nr:LytTR family DNA-binding domain-containing protein [Lachnospiraceae bacterium]
MLKIAVCDDEKVITGQIESMLLALCGQEGIAVDVEVFYDGSTLERSIQGGARYDLLYLDIQMKDENGITAAGNIRKCDENMLIIFVSGYDKYLMDLFRLDVFAFIRKPIDSSYFYDTFMEAHRKICSKKFYFTFRYKSEEYKIPCSEILFFESAGRQIKVNLCDGNTETFNGKLSEVEAKLSEGKVPFLRIHQSYLVNYHLIKSRTKSQVTLVNGMKLTISEDRQKIFSREYARLLEREINV